MAKTIKYKRPRKINIVSVSLALAAAAVGWVLFQTFPNFLQREEATRIMDETASKFGGQRNLYLTSNERREVLRRRMQSELILLGLPSTGIETWIEVDSKQEVRFGVLYDETFIYPWDVFPPEVEAVEVEYKLVLKKR